MIVDRMDELGTLGIPSAKPPPVVMKMWQRNPCLSLQGMRVKGPYRKAKLVIAICGF